MILITLAISISLALKSTIASFLLGRGAVPSGECSQRPRTCLISNGIARYGSVLIREQADSD